MGSWSEQQEVKKEVKEKDKVIIGGISTIIFIRIGNTILK